LTTTVQSTVCELIPSSGKLRATLVLKCLKTPFRRCTPPWAMLSPIATSRSALSNTRLRPNSNDAIVLARALVVSEVPEVAANRDNIKKRALSAIFWIVITFLQPSAWLLGPLSGKTTSLPLLSATVRCFLKQALYKQQRCRPWLKSRKLKTR